ncbi:hypothetical protein CK203_082775 [Vitis vinifera]|uniref:Uncharacterized protein n=1 Tax=Vitis vinifera TaxID=29760 RepID=A0A438DY94_VITVI|nr:hypothetical protein CK203_082775 [Vitis vinifera]
MWALEYDPDFFSMYEETDSANEKAEGSKGKPKSMHHVLKEKSSKLLTEARGLDDVVKILNDITGNLDAKKACTGAMKLHRKYLKKVLNFLRLLWWIILNVTF